MHRLGFALIVSSLALGVAHAQPKGDPAAGKRIAERWCAGCHIVSPQQRTGSADVLTFEAIAEKSGGDRDSLASFLTDPHPVMADIGLTRREVGDLVAYIDSLR
ncbi:c-type cytochrome [Jiella avicenniae]|uniref:Cytochrome c n=1 Tax=Jiella avicenniae TaxID=2907202 RepID=A0A9X1P6D7_9HYPH|nr:cytochrome c [Jiella avicenniae]MCE7030599.1 cytochrome c [Jiella avicenniae]